MKRIGPPLRLMKEAWATQTWEVTATSCRWTWRGFVPHVEISPIQNTLTPEIHIVASFYFLGLFAGVLIRGERASG